ncbi:RdgB/HAM1 family non-canonical purine NTP pyrophosphatase [Okibacterium endophyticum]
MPIELVLATHNQHKVGEFRRIIGAELPDVAVSGYNGPEPVENGVSFSDNALIKARAAAAHTGRIALADDSGICVDVMGGAPGIFSARWAGSRASDEANVDLLLEQLADMGPGQRRSSFACHIALVVPEGVGNGPFEHVSVGTWAGWLATEPSGEDGFGYDPVFVPDGYEVTSASLAPGVKNEISHRARAFADLVPVLRQVIHSVG